MSDHPAIIWNPRRKGITFPMAAPDWPPLVIGGLPGFEVAHVTARGSNFVLLWCGCPVMRVSSPTRVQAVWKFEAACERKTLEGEEGFRELLVTLWSYFFDSIIFPGDG